MGMHCLKCGGQLAPDAKEPLCSYCKSDIAREMINKNPTWALKVALEAIADALSDLQIDIKTIKEVQKEIIEAIKQKP
jgi:ribosome maturation protein Sdo1